MTEPLTDNAELTVAYRPPTTDQLDLEVLRVFTDAALRQDVWRGHDFWEPMFASWTELKDVQRNLEGAFAPDDLSAIKEYCDEHVWFRLCNLANMYEELVREWYLPTVFAQLTSYPTQGFLQSVVQPAAPNRSGPATES